MWNQTWKELFPQEGLSRERLKLARKVGLDEVEEGDVDSLLESISEELSTEELEDLEKQRCQLEEEVEAEQDPTVPVMKQLTIEIPQGFYTLLNQTMLTHFRDMQDKITLQNVHSQFTC